MVVLKVLLIHGLGRTPLSLLRLEESLKKAGCVTEQFSYWALLESFDHIVNRLEAKLAVLEQRGAYSIVAHSLGGLITRAALGRNPGIAPEHVVLLGTPNQLPRLAPYAWKLSPFQWFTGQCGFNLTRPEFFAQLPKLTVPYTIIAGTLGPRGPWSPFGEEVNDGIVALTETCLAETDRLISLPVEHTFMMDDPHVQATVLQSLGLTG